MFGEGNGRASNSRLHLVPLKGGHGTGSLQRDELHGDTHRPLHVGVERV